MFHLALMIKQPIILLKANDLFYENGYYKIENEMLFQPQNTIKDAVPHL
jgi:hypothetical protein